MNFKQLFLLIKYCWTTNAKQSFENYKLSKKKLNCKSFDSLNRSIVATASIIDFSFVRRCCWIEMKTLFLSIFHRRFFFSNSFNFLFLLFLSHYYKTNNENIGPVIHYIIMLLLNNFRRKKHTKYVQKIYIFNLNGGVVNGTEIQQNFFFGFCVDAMNLLISFCNDLFLDFWTIFFLLFNKNLLFRTHSRHFH